MNKQEIEALVLSVVNRAESGMRSEDSQVECKSEWPDHSKARQLAAHANSAHGEEIVWIVGLDERTGRITSPNPPELANWWAQMQSRFDNNIAPDMQDFVIQVTEDKFVTALIFSTDRAPYVIKVVDGGRVEREVPMRDGTRTRSAYRHELIHLLHPVAKPPSARLIRTSVWAIESGRYADLSFSAHLYVEQRADEVVMIPRHLIRVRLTFNGNSGKAESEELDADDLEITYDADQGSALGVRSRSDGLTIAGGAVLEIGALLQSLGEPRDYYQDILSVDVLIELGIAGASRPISAVERLARRRFSSSAQVDGRIFARWHFAQCLPNGKYVAGPRAKSARPS
jgi:hypothetical protein